MISGFAKDIFMHPFMPSSFTLSAMPDRLYGTRQPRPEMPTGERAPAPQTADESPLAPLMIEVEVDPSRIHQASSFFTLADSSRAAGQT
jgi:hypothetical protein